MTVVGLLINANISKCFSGNDQTFYLVSWISIVFSVTILAVVIGYIWYVGKTITPEAIRKAKENEENKRRLLQAREMRDKEELKRTEEALGELPEYQQARTARRAQKKVVEGGEQNLEEARQKLKTERKKAENDTENVQNIANARKYSQAYKEFTHLDDKVKNLNTIDDPVEYNKQATLLLNSLDRIKKLFTELAKNNVANAYETAFAVQTNINYITYQRLIYCTIYFVHFWDVFQRFVAGLHIQEKW
jgi:hypothetical protein